ncbi:MAG: conjugal transfer protein TraH, partial [Deltaproteobacteria bacterium]|nr:conjugal transfer protein TraH [Deltaproteobacteria bacterium]
GFSFMNFEHLVKKLQRMMESSPAVAFDLGLSVLCESCAKSIKSFEAISDGLNSIQLDDCKASQVLVTKAFQAAGQDNAKIRAAAEGEWYSDGGLGNMWKEYTDKAAANDGKATTPDAEMTQSCPTNIRDIFGTPGTTVLGQIAIKKGYSEDYVPLIRGIVGDVAIIQAGQSIVAEPILPCKQNEENIINGFLSGNVYTRAAANADCSQIVSTNKNFRMWVDAQLITILKKMKNKQSLSTTENKFINNVPAPTYTVMKAVARTDGGSALQASLSEIVANGYAMNMVTDLYELVVQSVESANAIMAKESKGPPNNCKTELFLPATEATQKLTENIYTQLKAVQNNYRTTMEETTAVMELAHRIERINLGMENEISKQFSPAVAKRFTSQ